MKKDRFLIYLFFILISWGCEKLILKDGTDLDSKKNFNSLWDVIDKNYTFFELKNINWRSIKDQYSSRVSENMTQIELFDIFSEMLFELRDGHVNLKTGFDVSRNWQWYLNFPPNFDFSVIERNYLGENYRITGGFRHTKLSENIAYIYYGSFSSSVQNLNFITELYKSVDGYIIDIRNNGGGNLSNAINFANRFADKRKPVAKQFFKTGPSHKDFSNGKVIFSEPTENYKIKVPVIILTNRSSYSASSFFVTMMKEFPNIFVLGDNTGGGSGIPSDYFLPNGWLVRFPTTKTTDVFGRDFEIGVIPDYPQNLNLTDLQNGIDSYIENAKKLIKEKG